MRAFFQNSDSCTSKIFNNDFVLEHDFLQIIVVLKLKYLFNNDFTRMIYEIDTQIPS